MKAANDHDQDHGYTDIYTDGWRYIMQTNTKYLKIEEKNSKLSCVTKHNIICMSTSISILTLKFHIYIYMYK